MSNLSFVLNFLPKSCDLRIFWDFHWCKTFDKFQVWCLCCQFWFDFNIWNIRDFRGEYIRFLGFTLFCPIFLEILSHIWKCNKKAIVLSFFERHYCVVQMSLPFSLPKISLKSTYFSSHFLKFVFFLQFFFLLHLPGSLSFYTAPHIFGIQFWLNWVFLNALTHTFLI